MNSKRITKSLRRSILNKAEEVKFKKDDEKVEKLFARLGDKIYAFLHPEKLLATINSMPEYMVEEEEDFIIFNNSTIKSLAGTKSTCWRNIHFTLSEPKRTFVRRLDEGPLDDIKKQDPKLFSAIKKAVTAKVKLFLRKEDFRNKLLGVLNQVGTTKRLIEAIPDANKWIPNAEGCSDLPIADIGKELQDI